MAKVEDLIQDFLAQKIIAVVGVSDKRETGCNLNYRISTSNGAPCYPDLKPIPEKPDAVFMLTSPKVTEASVREFVDLGIKHVWMHCLMGTKPGLLADSTSVSPSAVELCKANEIAVIPGSCPAQFMQSDFAHGMMRELWNMFGLLNVE